MTEETKETPAVIPPASVSVIGIKDTMEVFDFAAMILEKMAVAKVNDGKVDMTELMAIAASSAPSGINAVMGITNLRKELGDLQDEELDKVLEGMMRILRCLFKIALPTA